MNPRGVQSKICYTSPLPFTMTIFNKNISTDICTGKQLSYNVEDIAKELPLQVDGTTAESQIYHVVITMELTEEHKRSTESPSCIVRKF